MKLDTQIGYLRHGELFWFEGIQYRVGHLISNTSGYVACVDVNAKKVKRLHIDTDVEVEVVGKE